MSKYIISAKGIKSSWNTSTKLLKRADFFKSPTPLNIHGKRKVETFLGGIVSIALVIVLFIQGIQYCIEMFERKSLQFYQSNELEDKPSAIYLSKTNNFFLATTIVKNSVNLNLSEASPLGFKAYSVRYFRSKNGSRTSIKYPILWAPCSKTDFPKEIFGDVFALNSLEYGYCLDGLNYTNPDDGKCLDEIFSQYPSCIGPPDIYLQGTFFSEQFDTFQFISGLCDQDSASLGHNLKCDPTFTEEDLKKSEYKVNLYYTNIRIDPKVYETPNTSLIDNVYWIVSPEITQFADIYVDKITIQNYDDYIFNSQHHNFSFFTIPFDGIREMDLSRLKQEAPYIQSNFRRSNRNIATVRAYMKLGTIMVKLGGLTKSLMFLATFLVLSYMRYKYLMTLSNELYDFKLNTNLFDKPLTKKNYKKKIADRESLGEFKVESLATSGSPSELNPNREDWVVRKYFKNFKKEPLMYSEIHYFKSLIGRFCFFKKSPQEELARKARKLVLADLDIIKILQKVKEIDRLKIVILNEDQRFIFDSFEKPLVSLYQRRAAHLNTFSSTVRMEIEKRKEKTIKLDENENENEADIQKMATQQVLRSRDQYDSLSKYGKLYMSYRYLKDDQDPNRIKQNRKLLMMLNQDLLEVFARIDELIGKNPDPRKFEKIIRQLLDNRIRRFSLYKTNTDVQSIMNMQ